MAIDKSKWNTNIKVSQKTIDEIKKMGMKKALSTVSGASAAGKIGDASAKEWAEGVKRLYTAERVSAAMKGAKPKAATSGPMSAKTPAKYTTSGPKSANTKATYKSKGMSTGDKLKTAGLTAAAVASLVASRGKATGVASRLAPGLAKSGLGKVVMGNAPKVYPKVAEGVKVGAKGSFGKTTAATAKAAGKKIGTKSEFANKATETKVRAELAARASRFKEGVTVGPKGSFGKTGVRKPQTPPAPKPKKSAYKPKQSITKPPTANKKGKK